MASTERYVRADAAGGGDGTTDTNSGANGAFTWEEMITDLNTVSPPRVGYRYNVKYGSYNLSATTTLTGDGTVATPNIIRGFHTTPGDLDPGGALDAGRANGGTGALLYAESGKEWPVITYGSTYNFSASGADYLQVQNLRVVGNRSGTLLATGVSNTLSRLSVQNNSTNSSASSILGGATYVSLIDCDGELPNAGSTSGAFVIGASSIKAVTCHALSSPGYGFIVSSGSSIIIACVVDDCGLDGIAFTSTSTSSSPPICVGNTIYSAGGDGISFANYAYTIPGVFLNNHITDCAGYAINNKGFASRQLAGIFANNRFRDNVSGNIHGFDDWAAAASFSNVTTDNGSESSDFVDAPGGDFRLVQAAVARLTGLPINTDIGAIQRQEDYPAVANVLTSDTSDGVAGTFDEAARNTDPGVSNVWNGTSYKIANVAKTGTKRASSITNCSSGNIVTSITIDDVAGAVVIPAQEDVRSGVSVGDSGTGLLVLPAEEDVEAGVRYGAEALEFTGTLVAGGGGGISAARLIGGL